MQEAIIERHDYKIHFRSYSDKLYGVRVILNGESHFIINDRLKSDMAIETLYRLRDLSIEYREYGFLMLQKDNKVFVDANYKFDDMLHCYVKDYGKKVVDIAKYKYSLEYGIEKYRDRWDI